jgi:mono/diheme cytochrome c family protein
MRRAPLSFPHRRHARTRLPRLSLLALLAPLSWGCAAGGAATGAPESATLPIHAASGVVAPFTVAQARAGERVFNAACSPCHGIAEFRGRMFEITWMTRSVGDFLEHVSGSMPQDRPGSLEPEEYAAVVAYLLELNGSVPGDRSLPADPGELAGARWRE